MHIKFDNNRLGSFGDHQSTNDRQTDSNERPIFFRTLWFMKRRKNINVAIRVLDPFTILPLFTLKK